MTNEETHLISQAIYRQLKVVVEKYACGSKTDLLINADTVTVIAAQYASEINRNEIYGVARVGKEMRAATICKLVSRFRPIWSEIDDGDTEEVKEIKLLINEISALFIFESILAIDMEHYDSLEYEKIRRQLIYVLRFHSPTTEMLRTLALALGMKARTAPS